MLETSLHEHSLELGALQPLLACRAFLACQVRACHAETLDFGVSFRNRTANLSHAYISTETALVMALGCSCKRVSATGFAA